MTTKDINKLKKIMREDGISNEIINNIIEKYLDYLEE